MIRRRVCQLLQPGNAMVLATLRSCSASSVHFCPAEYARLFQDHKYVQDSNTIPRSHGIMSSLDYGLYADCFDPRLEAMDELDKCVAEVTKIARSRDDLMMVQPPICIHPERQQHSFWRVSIL